MNQMEDSLGFRALAGDNYVEVDVRVMSVGSRSITIMRRDGSLVFVGRSCIHLNDDDALQSWIVPETFKLRIFSWLVEKERLAS